MKVSLGVFQNYLINLKRESKRAQKMVYFQPHKLDVTALISVFLWACLNNWSTEWGLFNFLKYVHSLRIGLEFK